MTDIRNPGRRPAQVFHPGEFLIDELAARGIGIDAFAEKIDVRNDLFRAICRGDASVDVRTAMCIGRGLGTSCELWLNLQSAWDSWKEKP